MLKTKILIHNPCNERTRYYRNYNLFWDVFTEYLRNNFNVQENRYFSKADSERMRVSLSKGIHHNLLIQECDYIIENLETGEFNIISVADAPSGIWIDEISNPYCNAILVSQYKPKVIKEHGKEYFLKYKPWVYFQTSCSNLEEWYHKRKYIKNKSDILYFRGSSLQEREFLYLLPNEYVTNFDAVETSTYFNEIIQHKIAISIDGRGEFCYRDVECFQIGIPIIRFEYESIMDKHLIPNYHYISVPRPKDMTFYRHGTKEHVELFMNRYFEVINDEEYLNFVANNARHYYENNLKLDKVCKKTFEILNLQSWVK